MLYIIHTSDGPVGFTADEANEFLKVPDHQGLSFKIESAVSEDEHECPELVVPAFLREILA